MKNYFCIITFAATILCSTQTKGQSPSVERTGFTNKKGSISLNAGGEGLLGSFEMEFRFFSQSFSGLGFRTGVGFYTEDDFYMTIPLNVNYLFVIKPGKSYFELGAGVTYSAYHVRFSKDFHQFGGPALMPPWSFIPTLGYRQYNHRGVYWEIKFSPIVNKEDFTPWGGITIGKNIF